MPASQPANFNLQEFTDAGQLLVGGRLYTYAYGTTTQKAAYTDPGGAVPHTYTSDGSGGQYIALNARGELPAPLYLAKGSYDLGLKRADGSIVWTRKADGVNNQTVALLNVKDLGAAGDGVTNDSAVFQAAIDGLPAVGGRIIVPDAAYVLNTVPSWGTKSVFWDIGTGATFTGAGTGQNKFPSMRTNGGQIAAGPYIQSQSRIPYTLNNGGVAAYQIEMIQPVDVLGQSVALYLGAEGSNPAAGANVWAGNFLIKAAAGAGGTYQGIEVDVDCFSASALIKGISINGIGTANPDVALEVIRSDTTLWERGIDIINAIIGVQVRNTTGLQQGVTVGDPTTQASVAMNARQLSNSGDCVVLQRNTDTAPLGYLLRAIDAANSTSVMTIDVSGNLTTAGIVQGNHIVAKGTASAKPTGSFAIGSSNQQTVGPAGAASALPASPRGYLIGYDGPTKIVIPYYLAA